MRSKSIVSCLIIWLSLVKILLVPMMIWSKVVEARDVQEELLIQSIESTPMSSRTNTPKGSPTEVRESDQYAHVAEHGSMRVLMKSI